ncbi:60S ribosomal protein L37 [Fukomys damarensis]|uniref:60S ribosomal protein L37 n=1 Tax=Fukomys damarensis TaxID=885580 RepID=A0A091DC87_FUKDA|nr:60S ribosomal protein L37 [Fukomys damarensis]
MMKGTAPFVKCCNKRYMSCLFCCSKAYHPQKPPFGKCGYPNKHKRKYNWSEEAPR